MSSTMGDTASGYCEHGSFTDWCEQCPPVASRNGHGSPAADPADAPPRRYSTTTLSAVTAERVRWLWHGRIPLGKLTVLDGDPGLGKSTVALDIAAKVSTGARFWDDTRPEAGGVLLLSGEDGLADTVRPRLDAAGADATRVHALTGVRFATEDGDQLERDPHLGDVAQIEAAIRDLGVRLVIVDVLMAFLPSGTDSHRDQDVRVVLRRLKDVAESTGAAVLLLRHLNKSGAGAALYRGGGSIGIVGAARAGFLVARDPDEAGRVIMAPTKANLAAMPPACAYRLVDAGNGAARVEWLGEAAHHRADDLIGNPDEDRDERDALAGFLTDLITDAGGELPARDADRAVTAAFGKVGKATMKRARDRAGIRSRKGGMTSGWVWFLPDLMPDNPAEGSAEGSEDSGLSETGTFGTFVEPSQPPSPPEPLPEDTELPGLRTT